MTSRLAAIILVALVVGMAAASTADAGVTRARLQNAMQRYAVCRVHDRSAHVAGGISATDGGRVTIEVLMSNRAALIVNGGRNQRHRVRWITAHGVVQHLFRFGRLSSVAGKLDAAC